MARYSKTHINLTRPQIYVKTFSERVKCFTWLIQASLFCPKQVGDKVVQQGQDKKNDQHNFP